MKKVLVLTRMWSPIPSFQPNSMAPDMGMPYKGNPYAPGSGFMFQGGFNNMPSYPTAVAVYDTKDNNPGNYDPESNARAELELVKNNFISKFPEFRNAVWDIHEQVDLIEVKPS